MTEELLQRKNVPGQKPAWLRRRIPAGATYQTTQKIISGNRLHTVCQEACCPNMGECFSKGTATFLILGDRCSRSCKFCAILPGPTEMPDPEEPQNVAKAVQKIGLRYVVITSVTRDDLMDGGAGHFAETIAAIQHRVPDALVEVLIPDFQGVQNALETVVEAQPDVLNHNLETVPRLYATVRPQADYKRSLELIRRVYEMDPAVPTKSGLMLGLGEHSQELKQVFSDLLEVNCRLLTLGQYLQPTKKHLSVKRFIPPEEFKNWRDTALEMGFLEVASGPFVRSSYNAFELYRDARRMVKRLPTLHVKRWK